MLQSTQSNYIVIRNDELYHHGVKGMKWGVHRYQNEDGSLTLAGKRRSKTAARAKYSQEYHETAAKISKTKFFKNYHTNRAQKAKGTYSNAKADVGSKNLDYGMNKVSNFRAGVNRHLSATNTLAASISVGASAFRSLVSIGVLGYSIASANPVGIAAGAASLFENAAIMGVSAADLRTVNPSFVRNIEYYEQHRNNK